MARSASLLALLVAAGCAATTDEVGGHDDDIVDPSDSNIRSPEIGTVTELKLLPNTHVPRAVLVANQDTKFVVDLYDHVRTINDAENLRGADGYKQQINLIVMGHGFSFESLLKEIRSRRGLDANADVPLINPVENVATYDPWMQDFGEIAAVRGSRDPGKRWYGIFDAQREGEIDVGELGRLLGISVTQVSGGADYDNGGNYGGNTEATPDGTLYVGDHAMPAFIEGLKRLGNPNAIVIPSAWLSVGHIDEYVNLLPARNACKSAFIMASPLEGLNMARREPEDFARVGRGIGEALKAYARTSRGPNEDYRLEDFDTSREASTREEEFVRINVQAEQHVRDAITKLEAGTCVGEVIRLPQLYKDAGDGKAIAAFPNTVNSLVLRNHAVVPDPMIESVRRVTKERYAKALGSEANVHLIDDNFYHQTMGDVHCATNVIRELDLQYEIGR